MFGKKSRNKYDNQAKTALKWLEYILKHANYNEKFILIQHVPPGIFVWQKDIEVEYKDSSDPHPKHKFNKEDLNYAQEIQRILSRYSNKIVISLSGHVHTFRLSLPLYYHLNSMDSVLHATLCAFSPVANNNPAYYAFRFSSSETIDLKDIIQYEIDMTEFMTRKKSLTEYIISELFPVKNREINTASLHQIWFESFKAIINLFKMPVHHNSDENVETLQKYIMFMSGHQNSTYQEAKKVAILLICSIKFMHTMIKFRFKFIPTIY